MRRGEIGLSTNAIVTIVVAMVVLILLIVFITGGFTSVSEVFLGKAKQSIAPQATTADKLSWSFDNPPLQGEQFLLRVSVYNSGPQASGVTLRLLCPAGILQGNLRVSPKTLAPRATAAYQALGDIALDAPFGSHVCSLEAYDSANSVIAATDLILTLP